MDTSLRAPVLHATGSLEALCERYLNPKPAAKPAARQ